MVNTDPKGNYINIFDKNFSNSSEIKIFYGSVYDLVKTL